MRHFYKRLELFIDAFEVSGGFRLLRLARPPILFYGLYGTSTSEDSAESRLVELAFQRNQLAELLDCLLQCGCTPDIVKCQIVLDKLLYDLDRAIDLYALGTAENRDPEFRAVAYSYIANAIIIGLNFDSYSSGNALKESSDNSLKCLSDNQSNSLTMRITGVLKEIRKLLFGAIKCIGQDMCLEPLEEAVKMVNLPITLEKLKNLVSQELSLQGDMESRWQDLVQTMSPSCIPFQGDNFSKSQSGVFNVVDQVVRNALSRALSLNNQDFPVPLKLEADFRTPDNYELSLSAQASAQAIVHANLDRIHGTLAEGLGTETGETDSL